MSTADVVPSAPPAYGAAAVPPGIGNPVAHSRSPRIHGAFADGCRHAVDYDRIEAPLDAFVATRARSPTAARVAATSRCRSRARPTPRARADRPRAPGAGRQHDLVRGRRLGRRQHRRRRTVARHRVQRGHVPLRGRRVLLLGAGGAAAGALEPLLEAGPASDRRRQPHARRALEALVARFADDGCATRCRAVRRRDRFARARPSMCWSTHRRRA